MKWHDLFNFLMKVATLFFSGKVGKIAFGLISVGLMIVLYESSFYFSYADANRSVNLAKVTQNEITFVTYIGIIFLGIGLWMLYKEYNKLYSEKVMLYFGNMLKMGDSKAPDYAIESKHDRLNSITEYFDYINSYDKTSVMKEYEHILRSFKSRTKHKDIKKIYLGALGSTPYLFLLGTLLRNGHINNAVLDYNRSTEKWYQLPDFGHHATHLSVNDNCDIDDNINNICSMPGNDVGIALSYTYEINKDSIPNELKDKTLYLKTSLGFGNDKLSNISSQRELLNELVLFIDKFKSNGKNIHIFLSAQSSVCINLGKRYQDNTMGEIHIYNFNGESREYDWFITFNKSNVS